MKRSEVESLLEGIVDQLAAINHERWSHWQLYMHSKGDRLPDGALVLPAELVAYWEAQIATSYANLSEAEKLSDREQVRRYLPLIVAAFAGHDS